MSTDADSDSRSDASNSTSSDSDSKSVTHHFASDDQTVRADSLPSPAWTSALDGEADSTQLDDVASDIELADECCS